MKKILKTIIIFPILALFLWGCSKTGTENGSKESVPILCISMFPDMQQDYYNGATMAAIDFSNESDSFLFYTVDADAILPDSESWRLADKGDRMAAIARAVKNEVKNGTLKAVSASVNGTWADSIARYCKVTDMPCALSMDSEQSVVYQVKDGYDCIITTNSTYTTSQMANMAFKDGAGNIAVIYENNERMRNLTNEFILETDPYGLEVVDKIEPGIIYEKGESILNSWNSRNVGAVFVFLEDFEEYYDDMLKNFISNLDTKNIYWYTFFEPDLCSANHFTGIDFCKKSEKTSDFYERYEEIYGEEASLYAALGYYNTECLCTAITNSQGLSIQKAAVAGQTETFHSALGDFYFNESNNMYGVVE